MTEIQTLIKNLKYAIPVMTLLSLSKIVLFYSFFNINISDYIEIGEILNPFIQDALLYFVFFIIPVLTLTIFVKPHIGPQNLRELNTLKEVSFPKRLWKDFRQNILMYLIYLGLLVIMIFRKMPAEYIIGTLAFIPILSLIFWLRREILIKENIEMHSINIAWYNISTILISVAILVFSRTFIEIYQVKYAKNQKKVIFLKKTEIECSDSLVFLGRTKNFTFIYNRKQKETTIINNAEINKIVVLK